jgi:hypothetical protein
MAIWTVFGILAYVTRTQIVSPPISFSLHSLHKSWHYISSTSGGRSVGIVRSRTKGHGEFAPEECRLLRCLAVWLLEEPTFRKNALLHHQGDKIKW